MFPSYYTIFLNSYIVFHSIDTLYRKLVSQPLRVVGHFDGFQVFSITNNVERSISFCIDLRHLYYFLMINPYKWYVV